MKAIKKILMAFAFIIGLFIFLLFAIPSDNVKTHYKTYKDALGTNHYFTNGWLPDVFPQTIYDITTDNNLDINTSVGKFYFPNTDWLKIKRKFSILNETDKKEFKEFLSSRNSSEVYKYQDTNNIWIFACKPEKGYCEYIMDKILTA